MKNLPTTISDELKIFLQDYYAWAVGPQGAASPKGIDYRDFSGLCFNLRIFCRETIGGWPESYEIEEELWELLRTTMGDSVYPFGGIYKNAHKNPKRLTWISTILGGLTNV